MTLLDSINEFKLDNPPTDCIQNVKFGKHNNQFLITASWDSTVRLYDIFNKKMCYKFDHPTPVLDCAFQVCLFFLKYFEFLSLFSERILIEFGVEALTNMSVSSMLIKTLQMLLVHIMPLSVAWNIRLIIIFLSPVDGMQT